jgi:outer membrane protein assembly factor BamD (BamD/ComL family)
MKLLKYILLYLFLLTSVFAHQEKQNYTPYEYFTFANESFEQSQWIDVIKYSKLIIDKHPNSRFTKEALFYLGVAYFNLKDFEIANNYFTQYLKDDFNPKYFEEVMHYKFSIAQLFKQGAKKRMFNWKKGPKILDAKEDAVKIYDEIIASMPNHDLAIISMYSKAKVLLEDEEYKKGVSAFEDLIDRFEKHELAIQSYIEIQKAYLKQTTYKKQDPNILDLARLNLDKFKTQHPNEAEKMKILQNIILQIEEKFAKGFLEIAQFYEKTNKKQAASIYYTKIVTDFQNTQVAKIAEEKLKKLNAV